MFKFIDKLVKSFLDVYQDENNIRESYGNEYAERFSVVDPATGKKKVSVSKVLTRIFIVFMVMLCLVFLVRMISTDMTGVIY